jgi:hypothetical protein
MIPDEIIEIQAHTCKCGHTLEKTNRCIIEQKIDMPVINLMLRSTEDGIAHALHA